jgi:hypothetical protein
MGEAMQQHAPADVKVLVVANPANTNCLTLSNYAPRIPKENFTALTRLVLPLPHPPPLKTRGRHGSTVLRGYL